jgi:uroporphyrinogen-III synthase
MKGRVWITRTEPGALKTAQAVAALGYEPVVAPVLEVRRLKPIIDSHGFDALVFASRNALDAFCALCSRRAVTAWCVGEATAAAARSQGFQRVISAATAGGDAHALAGLIAQDADRHLRFFIAAAREPAWPLAEALRAQGFSVTDVAVYETVAVRPVLSEPSRLTHALIQSPRAAAAAVAVLAELSPSPPADLVLIAISTRAAAALQTALDTHEGLNRLNQNIRISAFPDEASMLKQLG